MMTATPTTWGRFIAATTRTEPNRMIPRAARVASNLTQSPFRRFVCGIGVRHRDLISGSSPPNVAGTRSSVCRRHQPSRCRAQDWDREHRCINHVGHPNQRVIGPGGLLAGRPPLQVGEHHSTMPSDPNPDRSHRCVLARIGPHPLVDLPLEHQRSTLRSWRGDGQLAVTPVATRGRIVSRP
jgi:hypothetical protein